MGMQSSMRDATEKVFPEAYAAAISAALPKPEGPGEDMVVVMECVVNLYLPDGERKEGFVITACPKELAEAPWGVTAMGIKQGVLQFAREIAPHMFYLGLMHQSTGEPIVAMMAAEQFGSGVAYEDLPPRAPGSLGN